MADIVTLKKTTASQPGKYEIINDNSVSPFASCSSVSLFSVQTQIKKHCCLHNSQNE
jgi:hypothetical protein